MSFNSFVASNSIDSFNENDSMDCKITLPKNVSDLVMEHGVTLYEQDEILCLICKNYVTSRGIYQFLCHLAGTEASCDIVSEEVKNEMLGILTLNTSSKKTSVVANPSGSFYGDVSVDCKITLPKNVADLVMEHGVTLYEQDEILCLICKNYVTSRGAYQFLCHLAGTEASCDVVSEEVKNEMLGILTLNTSSKKTSVVANPSGSFYGDVSVDSKLTVTKNVVDVILEHSVILGEDVVGCRYCDDCLATLGGYHFLCHLAGTESDVKACEGIGEKAKKEVLEIFSAFRESNGEGCVSVGEKRKCNDAAVGSSRDAYKRRKIEKTYRDNFKRKRGGSLANNEVKKSLREEACRAITRFFYKNAIPLDVVKSDEFKCMCDLVSRHGLGFEPPSFDDIKGKYLMEELWEDREL